MLKIENKQKKNLSITRNETLIQKYVYGRRGGSRAIVKKKIEREFFIFEIISLEETHFEHKMHEILLSFLLFHFCTTTIIFSPEKGIRVSVRLYFHTVNYPFYSVCAFFALLCCFPDSLIVCDTHCDGFSGTVVIC